MKIAVLKRILKKTLPIQTALNTVSASIERALTHSKKPSQRLFATGAIAFALALASSGCVEKTPKETAQQTSRQNTKTATSQPQAKPYPMIVTLTAGGFEPMWDASIMQVKEHAYQITLRFPEQTIKGQLELDNSHKSPSTGITRWQGLDDKQRPINIIHREEPCLNMAGDDSGSTLKIAWQGEVLRGCSTFTLNTASSSAAQNSPATPAATPE